MTTPATQRRKIERLEAQLEALQQFLMRERSSEYEVIRRNADMAVRIEQAKRILEGAEE